MITSAQLKAIVPVMTTVKLGTFLGPINDAMRKFGIDTPEAQAMFLAQIMHESLGCVFTEELWGPTSTQKTYEPPSKKATELGNTQSGDGFKYKGRGLIQITGRFNYAALTKALGVDYINHPEFLERPEDAAISAGWFWSTHGLSALAQPNTEAAFELVTRRINGGLNGLDDRQVYWARAKKALGVV